MKQVSTDNFGLIIAYLLPGFIGLWGMRPHIPILTLWFEGPSVAAPTVGGFLHVTLASVAAGMTISTIRWLLLDTVHYWMGVRPPAWDFRQLEQKVGAYQLLVGIHYQYYKFHANMFVALIVAYLSMRWTVEAWPISYDIVIVALLVVLFAGSRDNLKKYFNRAGKLLSSELESTALDTNSVPSQSGD